MIVVVQLGSAISSAQFLGQMTVDLEFDDLAAI
jgi:hypothetical protein